MKNHKITLDFSDTPSILSTLRHLAAKTNKTQKALVREALTAYFSGKHENELLLTAANDVFAEWDNPEDEVYNEL